MNCTPIQIAIDNDNIQILKVLLQNGANPNLYQQGYLCPLNRAIQLEKLEIITFLIEKGADVNQFDGKKLTPITWAIDIGNMEIMVQIQTYFPKAVTPH